MTVIPERLKERLQRLTSNAVEENLPKDSRLVQIHRDKYGGGALIRGRSLTFITL